MLEKTTAVVSAGGKAKISGQVYLLLILVHLPLVHLDFLLFFLFFA